MNKTRTLLSPLLILGAVACSDNTPADDSPDPPPKEQPPVQLRVATFNSALSRAQDGQLLSALSTENDAKAKAIAEIIQRVRPDVLLINEMDWDAQGKIANAFQNNYLNVAQQPDLNPLNYDHIYVPTTNTGTNSGLDLDQNGRVVDQPGSRDFAGDSYGYGEFPGQYGMVIYSRYPIDVTRTFQNFKWSDMPNNLIPTQWYGDVASSLRLSSKNHVDVAIKVKDTTVHILASHPTPPGFDGEEDRNGRRNHDEIRFWVDYLNPQTSYIYDDDNQKTPLQDGEHFVILGDLNCDPNDGQSRQDAIKNLLSNPRVQNPNQSAPGGAAAAQADGQVNTTHTGDPAQDTANFSDGVVGNLRVDYALPSATLPLLDHGLFWPTQGQPGFEASKASDHRMVWVEVNVPQPAK